MIDVKAVQSLRSQLDTRYSAQSGLDDKMLDMYLQKGSMEVNQPKTKLSVRPVGTGLAGFLVDQRVAVLSGPLFLRVISRGGQAADKHASDRLEPYLNAAVDVLEEDQEVRGLIEQDVLIYGRAWTPLMPAPFFWADETMREMAEKKASKKEFEEYKAQNLPIVWRHWDAKSVKPVFNDRGEPSALIYIRKMTPDDIEARWGKDYLPDGYSPRKDASSEIEVIDYVNRTEIGSIIGTGEKAKAPKSWEHHMGTVPVAYFAGGRLPANNYGLVWKGAMFHARELLHSMDETMTDIRTNIRDFTIAPPVIYVNPELRGQVDGWPSTVEWKAGDTTINLLAGEKADRFPANQVTIDAYQYLAKAREYLELTSLREGLTGTGPSGQSAVHLTGSNQISKAELQRYYDGLKRGYKKVGELLLRCPEALNKGLGLPAQDPITVRAMDKKHESKEIKVTPQDTKDWYRLVRADIDMNLPINEGAAVQNYSVATSSGGLSRATARERFLNVQNPYEEDDRIAEENLYTAIVTLATQYLTQRASGAIDEQGALSPLQLIRQSANLPQFAQEALAKSFSPEQSQELGNIARGLTNEARGGGRQQQLSELGGNNAGMPQ